MQKLTRISIDQRVCMGQPTIRGTRITVSVILKLLAEGKPEKEIIHCYPELKAEDIHQAMQYAAWAVSDRFDLHVPAMA